MPIGSPKPQTIATKKYEQKAGYEFYLRLFYTRRRYYDL